MKAAYRQFINLYFIRILIVLYILALETYYNSVYIWNYMSYYIK